MRVCDACKAVTLQRRVAKSGAILQREGSGSICNDCGKRPALGAGLTCCAGCQVAREHRVAQTMVGKRAGWESQGLCKTCGRGPPESDSKYCKECKERSRESSRKRWNKRDGKCKKCRVVLSEGSTETRCADCRARKAQREKDRRNKARKNGLCCRCLKHPRLPGQSKCESCIEHMTDRIYKRHPHRKPTDDAQNPDQAEPEVIQGSGEEESLPKEVQNSEAQERMEIDSEDADLVDEIVVGSGIDRMAIDYIVN